MGLNFRELVRTCLSGGRLAHPAIQISSFAKVSRIGVGTRLFLKSNSFKTWHASKRSESLRHGFVIALDECQPIADAQKLAEIQLECAHFVVDRVCVRQFA